MNNGKEDHIKKIKLLHFFPAKEKKFATQARLFFERDYLDNSWLYWSESELSAVDELDSDKTALTYDWVIFHSAPFKLIKTIKKISKKSRTIVQFWGGDYSTVLVPRSRLYSSKTRHEFWWKWNKGNFSMSFIRHRWYLAKGMLRRSRYLDAIGSCDCLCFLAGESEMKWLPGNFESKRTTWHVNYAYGNEKDWSDSFEAEYDGASILLGNSATLANNHVDVIELLSNTPSKPNQILIPLSYGIPEVQQRIESIASLNLAERARPLINFLPQKEYFHLLESVGFVIMGHMRQQALGNLYWAFFTKRTVYLWEESDLFGYFSKMDFEIRRIDSIEEKGLIGLREIEAEKNKRLVSRLVLNDFGRELELCLKKSD